MIPRRIIQTARTSHLSTLEQAGTRSAILNNPSFEYQFYDDEAVLRFVADTLPEHRKCFERLPKAIQKIDFFRYLAVYHLGGFYFDTDVLLCAPLDDLLSHQAVFSFERLTWSDRLRREHGMDWELGNYAFGAEAGDPFLGAIIQNCLRALDDPRWVAEITDEFHPILRPEFHVIYSTGPGLVSRTFAQNSDLTVDLRLLFPADVCDKETGWNRFGSYGLHIGAGSWRIPGGPFRRLFANHLMQRNEKRAMEYTRRQHRADTPAAGGAASRVSTARLCGTRQSQS